MQRFLVAAAATAALFAAVPASAQVYFGAGPYGRGVQFGAGPGYGWPRQDWRWRGV
jgi:hypothetical protein